MSRCCMFSGQLELSVIQNHKYNLLLLYTWYKNNIVLLYILGTYTRKRPSCSHQPKGKKKHKQSETSTNDEDLEESLKSRYQG